MNVCKVVCTGGVGFIGSHLVEELCKRQDEVVVYDNLSRGQESQRNLSDIVNLPFTLEEGDILDFEKLKTVIKSGVNVVYHLAALPSHRLALTRPHDYLQIDLAGTANVLEAARLCNPKPLVVLASSNKVYGKQECPWQEDKLPQPEGPYAVAKWGSEKIAEMYNKYFDVPVIIVRYHHVAGTRSNSDLALSVFTEQALRGELIEVHGKFVMRGMDDNKWDKQFLSCSANYTHVNDAVRATLLAVDKYKGFNIFNIANKKVTLVEDMAKYVINKTNSKSEIKLVEMDRHETLNHISDVSKAEKELGFVAELPIKQAMDEYIEWRLK